MSEETTEKQPEEITPETPLEATEEVTRAELPNLRVGQTVRLHLRISEGKKDRIQIYQGIISDTGSRIFVKITNSTYLSGEIKTDINVLQVLSSNS